MSLILLYKIVFILTAFGAGTIAADIFLQKSERPRFDKIFGIMSLALVAWAAGRFGMMQAEDAADALFWGHFLYTGSILVHVLFLHTILVFLELDHKRWSRVLLGFFYALGAILIAVNYAYLLTGSHMFITSVVPKLGFQFYEVPDAWHNLHLINYLVAPTLALILMFAAVRRATGQKREQIKWVIFASVLGFLGGNSVVPLVYGFALEPFLLILVPFYLPILGYAIARHRLFNIKVLTTELLTFALWSFILVRIFVSENATEQTANSALLALTIIIGVFLIRSVRREVEQRERIEKLATELEAANDRLKELDQLKSEFVSLATHQIRGPLTAIKGYTSMILQGDLGSVPENIRGTINTIFESSNALTVVVSDFLDVSRIEQGSMKYEFTAFDFSKFVQSVGEEFAPIAERKGLRIQLQVEPDIMVHADVGKVRQVIGNLVDNAVKYTPQGSIAIGLKKEGDSARLTVRDTGVGIKPETLPRLFQKFSRAEDASKANVMGTGLGLYVARKLLEAQGGRIWAESEGEGKGSIFFVELPLRG